MICTILGIAPRLSVLKIMRQMHTTAERTRQKPGRGV
jgi:hypothetical protein